MLSRKSLEGVDLRALWTAGPRRWRISMLSLSTPRIDADWAEASIAICLSPLPDRISPPKNHLFLVGSCPGNDKDQPKKISEFRQTHDRAPRCLGWHCDREQRIAREMNEQRPRLAQDVLYFRQWDARKEPNIADLFVCNARLEPLDIDSSTHKINTDIAALRCERFRRRRRRSETCRRRPRKPRGACRTSPLATLVP